jgi:hypothetical protein
MKKRMNMDKTINDEKKYKEALERARKLQENSNGMILKKWLWNIFPELKENEDERIRKELIELISYMHDADPRKRDWIEWLKKQGEVKETLCEKCKKAQPSHSCQDITALGRCAVENEQKVEPKFHEGEWITNGDYTWKIVEVKPLYYILQSQDGNIIVDDTISHADEHFHSFTIKDARDGDVLCCESGWTCIFKTLNSDNISFSSYCFMDNTGWFCETGSESHTLEKAFIKAYNGEIYPSTKEQRDLLFQKMKEAGYMFDFEKKELKKIENKKVVFKKDEKSTAWSKNDDYNVQCLIAKVTYDIQKGNLGRNQELIDWLKTLKYRMNNV